VTTCNFNELNCSLSLSEKAVTGAKVHLGTLFSSNRCILVPKVYLLTGYRLSDRFYLDITVNKVS